MAPPFFTSGARTARRSDCNPRKRLVLLGSSHDGPPPWGNGGGPVTPPFLSCLPAAQQGSPCTAWICHARFMGTNVADVSGVGVMTRSALDPSRPRWRAERRRENQQCLLRGCCTMHQLSVAQAASACLARADAFRLRARHRDSGAKGEAVAQR